MKENRNFNVLYFFEAWILLHVARLVIFFVPFKKIVLLLGQLKKKVDVSQKMPVLDRVVLGINRASSLSFHRSRCYDRALAAKWMLQIRNIHAVIYFGVAKEQESGLSAHAWVSVGERIVVGGEDAEKFTPLIWYGH